MNEPIPTPFDIIDIPYVAWSPGVGYWATLGILLCLGSAAIWRRAHPRTQKRSPGVALAAKILADSQRDIQRLGDRSDISTTEMLRLSHQVRRALEFLTERELGTLSARELAEVVAEEQSGPLASAFKELIAIEALGYAPPSASSARVDNGTTVVAPVGAARLNAIKALISSARDYARERQAT